MGSFREGDVVLAPVSLDNWQAKKIRPLVIIADAGRNAWETCPVSSTPPSKARSIPLDLQDFDEGGLDIVSTSFILVDISCRIQSSDIIAKKGRLSAGMIAVLMQLVSPG